MSSTAVHIGVRGGVRDVEQTRDLSVTRASNPQIERLRGPFPSRGIFPNGTIPTV